jgi:hypothetical protein
MEADSIQWQHGKESDAGVGRKKATLMCGPMASASERERKGRRGAYWANGWGQPVTQNREKGEWVARGVRSRRGRTLLGCDPVGPRERGARAELGQKLKGEKNPFLFPFPIFQSIFQKDFESSFEFD